MNNNILNNSYNYLNIILVKYRCWINGSLWIYKGPILVILVVCSLNSSLTPWHIWNKYSYTLTTWRAGLWMHWTLFFRAFFIIIVIVCLFVCFSSSLRQLFLFMSFKCKSVNNIILNLFCRQIWYCLRYFFVSSLVKYLPSTAKITWKSQSKAMK